MDESQIFGMVIAVLVDAINSVSTIIDGDLKGDISCIRFNPDGTMVGIRVLIGGVDMFVYVSHTPDGLMDSVRDHPDINN